MYVRGIDRSRLNVYWLIPCFRNFIISVLNVAAGKAPMQSSVADGGIPQRAVDGSTSTRFDLSTCSLTEVEKSPWWYVNLLEPYMVQLVRIDFGQSCCGKYQHKSVCEIIHQFRSWTVFAKFSMEIVFLVLILI